jgi:hypothetical protein
MPDYADEVLNIVTMSQKGISSGRYDQSLDLRECDTIKGVHERTRNVRVPPWYL